MKQGRRISLSCSVAAALLGAGVAYAQQSYDQMTCRAGTMTVLAKSDDMVVWSLDHRGVTQSMEAKGPFDGSTQRCIGVVASIAGKVSANGWCRNVDAKTGDMTLVDWVASDKPGAGTFTFRYGTGKWKGITGGGTYAPVGPTRPVDEGTYQNCVRIKGTMTVPG